MMELKAFKIAPFHKIPNKLAQRLSKMKKMTTSSKSSKLNGKTMKSITTLVMTLRLKNS